MHGAIIFRKPKEKLRREIRAYEADEAILQLKTGEVKTKRRSVVKARLLCQAH